MLTESEQALSEDSGQEVPWMSRELQAFQSAEPEENGYESPVVLWRENDPNKTPKRQAASASPDVLDPVSNDPFHGAARLRVSDTDDNLDDVIIELASPSVYVTTDPQRPIFISVEIEPAEKTEEGSPLMKLKRPEGFPDGVWSSTVELWGLQSFLLSYGFVLGSMGLCVIPMEGRLLWPNNPAMGQAYLLALCGATQVFSPIVGFISDQWRAETVLGRRWPVTILAYIFSIFGVALMTVASWIESYALYSVALWIGMMGFNSMYAMRQAIPYDLLSRSHIPLASNLNAANGLIGSSLGFLTVMFTNHFDHRILYVIYMVMVSIATFICMSVDRRLQGRMERCGRIELNNQVKTIEEMEEHNNNLAEKCWYDKPIVGWVNEKCTVKNLCGSLYLSKTEHHDFYLVFMSRTSYYMAVSVQTFISLFLRDVVGTTVDADQRFQLAAIALMGQSTGAITAINMGRIQKCIPMSKRKFIYCAAAIMTMTYVGFALTPMFSNGFHWLLLVGVMYGVGNGVFLAVDYAVAVQVLPEADRAAEFLGLWGISAFIGSAIGPIVLGITIEVIGGQPSLAMANIWETKNLDSKALYQLYYSFGVSHMYNYYGYFAMLIVGALFCFLSGSLIRGVRAQI